MRMTKNRKNKGKTGSDKGGINTDRLYFGAVYPFNLAIHSRHLTSERRHRFYCFHLGVLININSPRNWASWMDLNSHCCPALPCQKMKLQQRAVCVSVKPSPHSSPAPLSLPYMVTFGGKEAKMAMAMIVPPLKRMHQTEGNLVHLFFMSGFYLATKSVIIFHFGHEMLQTTLKISKTRVIWINWSHVESEEMQCTVGQVSVPGELMMHTEKPLLI